MNNKDFISNFLLPNPESVLQRVDLSHKGTEIMDIYERFDQAAKPLPAYKWGKELLYATRVFRVATEPEGMSAKLRSEMRTDADLKAIFQSMYEVIQLAQSHLTQPGVSDEDRKILSATIAYCKMSISKRMASLKPDDRLCALWQVSELKQAVEK